MTPTKILELKGKDLMTGLSIQSSLALGGLFQTATNFDPFEKMGYLKSSLYPVIIDSAAITTQVNLLASAPAGSASYGYVFALGNRSGTGAKCLYRIKTSDMSVTDLSSNIDTGITEGIEHNGLVYYNNRVIYAENKTDSFRSINVDGTDDKEILETPFASFGLYPKYIGFAIGPDGYLYYTPDSYSIGKIVTSNGTTSNTRTAFTFTNHYLRAIDVTCDGNYLIFIASNNSYKSNFLNATCQVFFWDTLSAKASVIYNIPESYLISCRYVDGKVLILGSKGLWVCNSVTPPKLVHPLTSDKLPRGPNQVSVNNNIMYWNDSNEEGNIYAYGSLIGDPILFTPFSNGNGTLDNLSTALCSNGNYLISAVDAGTNTSKVYLQNSGTTSNTSLIRSATTILPQSYSLSYIKVALSAPLSAGQEVEVALLNGNGGVISVSDTKTFASVGAKQTLIFNPKPNAGSFNQFEDCYVSLSIVSGAEIQRVAVYGVPIDDFNQKL